MMKKFVVERILPGAGNLSQEELQAFASQCCKAINMAGQPYHWIQSYITDDKIYCIHIAESEERVREHSRIINIPVNRIAEVKFVIDPLAVNVQQKGRNII